MQPNQQPNQQPPGQVPDHRFQEIMEQLRKVQDENNKLRGTIDYIVAQQRNPTPQQEKPLFEENVDKALDQKIQKAIEPAASQIRNQLLFMYENQDKLSFQQKWGVETYEKYKDQLIRAREEANRRGATLSHEDAYKHIYFEENSRKPQPKPEPPKAPVFDGYTQQWINPETPPAQAAPQAATGQAPQYAQAQAPTGQYPTGQYPAGQYPGVPQVAAQYGAVPQYGVPGQPYPPTNQAPPQENFNLPPDMVSPGLRPEAVTPSLAADDKGAKAWLDKYGDVPL